MFQRYYHFAKHTRILFQVMPKFFASYVKPAIGEISYPKTDINEMALNSGILPALSSTLYYLQNSKKFTTHNLAVPKSILLSGEPKTGKITLAQSISGHAGAAHLYYDSSALSRSTELTHIFNKAREHAPCVLTLDNIDSIVHKNFKESRSEIPQSNDLTKRLLEEMANENTATVPVMITHNKIEDLDPEFTQSPYLTRHIILTHPDLEGRKIILARHLKDKNLSPEVTLELLADLSEGFSRGQLIDWIKEAAIFAYTEGSQPDNLNLYHFDMAKTWLEKANVSKCETKSESKFRSVAIHEAGHALVAHLLGRSIYKISINHSENSPGRTEFLTKRNNTPQDTLNEICIFLAGRCAEEIYNSKQLDITDFTKAKNLAVELIGLEQTWYAVAGEKILSPNQILKQEKDKARVLLEGNRKLLEKLIAALTENKEILRPDFLRIMNEGFPVAKSHFWKPEVFLPPSRHQYLQRVENCLKLRSDVIKNYTYNKNAFVELEFFFHSNADAERFKYILKNNEIEATLEGNSVRIYWADKFEALLVCREEANKKSLSF